METPYFYLSESFLFTMIIKISHHDMAESEILP